MVVVSVVEAVHPDCQLVELPIREVGVSPRIVHDVTSDGHFRWFDASFGRGRRLRRIYDFADPFAVQVNLEGDGKDERSAS